MVQQAIEKVLKGEQPETEKWVAPEVISEHVGIPVQSLAKWRSEGSGPPYAKVGRHVRYRLSAVDQWIDSQTTIPAAS